MRKPSKPPLKKPIVSNRIPYQRHRDFSINAEILKKLDKKCMIQGSRAALIDFDISRYVYVPITGNWMITCLREWTEQFRSLQSMVIDIRRQIQTLGFGGFKRAANRFTSRASGALRTIYRFLVEMGMRWILLILSKRIFAMKAA